ncbi:agamous-like MADS-box protein AGL29 [Tasmannia lanceolata]|uniref:agamous-like MADS-box protein AGL29 n=1 Tax=Tasmannia lanceolata TaxID=3420 RepID=UPI004064B6CA
MGKRKIEIKKIEKKDTRQVCFSKRRKGIFKKAAELCILCNAEIAIIAFSPGGKPFVFGHPNAETTINQYLSNASSSSTNGTHLQIPLIDHVNGVERQITVEKERTKRLKAENIGNEEGLFWWDLVNIDEYIDKEHLEGLQGDLEKVREKVGLRLEELNRASIVEPLAACPGFNELPPLPTIDWIHFDDHLDKFND